MVPANVAAGIFIALEDFMSGLFPLGAPLMAAEWPPESTPGWLAWLGAGLLVIAVLVLEFRRTYLGVLIGLAIGSFFAMLAWVMWSLQKEQLAQFAEDAREEHIEWLAERLDAVANVAGSEWTLAAQIVLTLAGFALAGWALPRFLAVVLSTAGGILLLGHLFDFAWWTLVAGFALGLIWLFASSRSISVVIEEKGAPTKRMTPGWPFRKGLREKETTPEAPAPERPRLQEEADERPASSRCIACGEVLAAGSEFCGECGKRVTARAAAVYPRCQAENEKDANFCFRCGAELAPQAPAAD